MKPRRLPRISALPLIAIVALAASSSACILPKPWAPQPPIGSGYAYRFEGVHRSVSEASTETWRAGAWRGTSFYGFHAKGVSERENVFERAARERYLPGTLADGRFNAHLGDLGERLAAE